MHLYQAEKKDIQNIYKLLIEFKNIDLVDSKYPEVDKNKILFFINTMLDKGKIILLNDLDKNEVIGCCIFHKSEFWFSKSGMIKIQIIYIKQGFRNFKLVKTIEDSVKKVADGLPIVLGITSGLQVDAVFQRLGFENMGGNWRLL